MLDLPGFGLSSRVFFQRFPDKVIKHKADGQEDNDDDENDSDSEKGETRQTRNKAI